MKQILLCVFLFPLSLFSQHFEAGMMIGGANYLGDLSANSSEIYIKETNIAAGAFAKYNINHLLALRLSLSYATVSGKDSNSSNSAIMNRNLDFRSNIYEVGLIGEFNILGYEPTSYSGAFSPYLFGGIAFFQFNPQGTLNEQWIDLQPLGTEGQNLAALPDRTPYKLNEFAIPFGLGVKYALTESINIGLELGLRKLFTDYLDDVSLTYPGREAFLAEEGNEQALLLSDKSLSIIGNGNTARGDSRANDWYFIAGFTVSFNFMDNGLIGGRSRSRGSKVGCPTF
jgi:hypothetical protein